MGECGCYSCGTRYRFKASDGWYVLETLPGCDGCDCGPGIRILTPSTANLYYAEDLFSLPVLPFIGKDDEQVAMIKCGMSRSETTKAAIATMTGSEVENGEIDEYLAEVIGEEFWDGYMNKSPIVIFPNEGFYHCGCGELVPDGEFCIDCDIARDILEDETDVR